MFHYWIELYLAIGIFAAAKYGKGSPFPVTKAQAAATGFLWPLATIVMWLTDNDH